MDTAYSRFSTFALQDYNLEDILVADPRDGSLRVLADPVDVQGNLVARNLGATETVVCGGTVAAGGLLAGNAQVSGSLTVNADISTQNLRVSGGLTVTSHTNTGSISVTGPTTTGSISVTGSTNTGSLAVTGATTTGSMSVTGSTSTGSLAVGSNAACQSLTVSSGTLNMGSNLVLGPGGALANTVLESGLMRLARTGAYSNLGAQNVQLWKGARLVAYPTVDPRLWFESFSNMPGAPKVIVDTDGMVPWQAIKGAPQFDDSTKGMSIAGLVLGGLGLAVGAASMFTGQGGIGVDLAKLLKDMVHGQDQYDPVDDEDDGPPLASDFRQLKHRPIAIPTDGTTQRLGIAQDVCYADTTRAYVLPATAFTTQTGNPSSAAFDATATANRWLLLDYGARTMNVAATAWTKSNSAATMTASNDGLYAAGGVRILDTGARTLDNLTYVHVAGDVVIDGRLRVGQVTIEPDGTILQDGAVLTERGRAQYMADAASSDRFISRFNELFNFDDSLI